LRVLALAGLLILVMGVSAFAAPSYHGFTGNIMTPDSLTAPVRGFDVGYHGFFVSGNDVNVFHGNVGLLPAVEVGVAWFDPENGDSDFAINGKWRFIEETATRPAVAAGVFDLLGDLDSDDDASFYLLVSKNLTAVAEDVVNGESKPLRGTVGFGTGTFDGLFAALDWTFLPKVSLMLEYVDSDTDSLVNGGIRYAVSPEVRVDAAMIDFDDFAAGISFTKGF
jgi:hypothetical protein